MKNPHYLINEKNGGIIPKPKDERHLYINTSCGWCEECRKEIANNWRIRLMEEYKSSTEQGQFVTMSFAPEQIKKLENEIITKKWKGINGKEIDVNMIAAYAVRMWTERWRKIEKRAPRHWLITELGHKNSERIHLHGIIWTEKRLQIKNTWKYGNVYIGEYVNIRTMNYITKYITKIDRHHKGYKQRILTSKGLGIEYIKSTRAKQHQYNGEKTITYYKTPEGYKYTLPKYYKNKLWTEEERQQLWTIALNKNTLRIKGVEYDKTKTTKEELDKILECARESNILSGYGDNRTVNKKWLITEVMKMNYKDAINYDKQKLVKSCERRKVEKIIYWANQNEEIKIDKGKTSIKDYGELDKTRKVDKIIYGDYIGTTTEAERNYNMLLQRAREMQCSVREVRLIDKEIIKRKESILENI